MESSFSPREIVSELDKFIIGQKNAKKAQKKWDSEFNEPINVVLGNEWVAGNLSYHLKSRPTWEGTANDNILKNSSQFICINDVCLGRY